jgi:two-component system cell cycle sensor histidine kinase/response regulator CckA
MALAHILVVEDEGIVARGIQSELENLGYDVPDVASSGEEAIEKALHLHPDLVLMDVVLKGDMDGIEAARRIHEQLDVPVVYLSAYEDENTIHRARGTEPFGYLLKPYEEKELHTTIEMALHKHRAEQKVREAERWWHATLRCIDDAVIATDTRLRVRFLNPIAEAVSGWSSERASGGDLAEVCRLIDEKTSAPLEGLAKRAIQQGAGIDLPAGALLVAQDGRETPVEGHLSPIYDDAAALVGVVVVIRDISERRHLEDLRRRHEEQRRQTEKMEALSRMAGGVAHDFNNLLTVVLGNTALVLGRLDPANPNRELLADVETAALRAARRVEDLLAFSGRSTSSLRPIRLNDEIEETVDRLRPLLEPRVSIECNLDPELWMVQADSAQINDMLLNLSLNAEEAMPEGGQLRIETQNVTIQEGHAKSDNPRAQPGDHIRLRVSDTGRGIPPEVLVRIYEPFFTTKEPNKGVGLGLTLVFGIVERHHGWIECMSYPDEGTVFDVYLPRYWQRPAEAPLPPLEKRPREGPPTILVADDEAMLRDLARTILEGHGYRVIVAEDGQHALELFRQQRQRIDLVILDLTMPRLSGKDAWREMLEIDPDVRVLFSSGYFAEDLTADDGKIMGFVNKPYRPSELTEMVRSALEHVRQ